MQRPDPDTEPSPLAKSRDERDTRDTRGEREERRDSRDESGVNPTDSEVAAGAE